MKDYTRIAVGVIGAAILFFAATIKLENVPPLWWDEGWTLSVARNWVELGHYGRLLDGQPAPPGLEAAFTVTGAVALSFHLLGIGIWQGRLVGVVFTFGAIGVLYHLARRLYNHSVALMTLIVVLFLSPGSDIHPIIMGRQVLGEPHCLFYLLAGYAAFLRVLEGRNWFLLAAVGLWGVALTTKAQVLPFWAASLMIPFFIAIFSKHWRLGSLLGTAFACSLILSRLLQAMWHLVVHKESMPRLSLSGMYEVTALVGAVPPRITALVLTIVVGLPSLVGLCYGASRFITRIKFDGKSCTEVIKLALLILGGSWFGWYVFLSVGWPRYLFPATFIASMFLAALLCNLVSHFKRVLTSGAPPFKRLTRKQHAVRLVIILLLITIPFLRTVKMLYQTYTLNSDASVLQAAEFINNSTAQNALLETYDSELFFLLNRRYHYPPDQVHVDLNRRTFLGQSVSINYDPLAANPDYLVVGPHSKLWKLYDPVLKTGVFRLVRSYPRYEVYERVR